MWNFFSSSFGGTEIKREYIKSFHYNSGEIEATFKDIKMTIIPPLSKLPTTNPVKPRPIFYRKVQTLADLKERILKVMAHNGMEYTADDIRFWRVKYPHDFASLLKCISEEVLPAAKKEPSEEDKEMANEDEEKNTGVKFPGISIELMMKSKLTEVEFYSNDCMCVEVRDKEKGFTFYFKKEKILGYGKCEYCYTYKAMLCQCICEEV